MPTAIDDATFAELQAIVSEAAALAMQYFRRGERIASKVQWKAGNSPVTEADFAVDWLLRERLSAVLPDAAWLSEETADTPDRLERERVIIVDPIDGTRAFMAGDPRFAVSVAIVDAGRPVAAMLHAPALAHVFTARIGRGAALNGAPIHVASGLAMAEARLAGPKFLIDPVARRFAMSVQQKAPSLALRFAQVASGDFGAALASADAHDWDVAAADLILHEAGASLRSLEGAQLAFNRPDTKHGILIAAPHAFQQPLRDAVMEVVADWQSRAASRR